jgi:DUF4097 and DUF4098 domain-containing protein YvlB
MKSKWIIASILVIALMATCGASLYAVWTGAQMAQESGVHVRLGAKTASAKTTEEKTLTVNTPAHLAVINDFGDVSVVAGGDGQINVKAEKTAWGSNEAEAQAALKGLKIVYDQTGNKLTIRVEQPVEINVLQIGPGSGNVKFTITVPKETAVMVTSANGNLSLSGTTGSADLQTEFGDLSLEDVRGEVSGQSSNGKITAKNILSDKKITLSSEFGRITAGTIQGSEVMIASTNGELDLTGIKASGLFKATSEFGGISISNSQAGMAEFHSTNGAVRLEKIDLAGKLGMNSEFGDLTLIGVKAMIYELEAKNGKISVDDAQGQVTAHSEFGDVEVLNADSATLDLSSKNGSVTFSGSLGAGPHSVTSEFGDLKLSLPAGTAIDVDLKTEFGEINSDFELTLTVKGEVKTKHLQGKINGGGALLTVKTNNGNLTLEATQ